MKIIDSFTFFNEIDILKMRLSLLYEKVDHFVICEANVRHSGIKKRFKFLDYQKDFLPWKDKIIYLKFEPDISIFDFSQKRYLYKLFFSNLAFRNSTEKFFN